jgi:hypothetical protein
MQQSEKEMIRPFRKLSEGRRMNLKDEFVLALLPTVTVLAVLGFFETMGRQRILFSSLASSAFLIYLDPFHAANEVRTLVDRPNRRCDAGADELSPVRPRIRFGRQRHAPGDHFHDLAERGSSTRSGYVTDFCIQSR